MCDGYPDGPARKYADRSYVIPVTEIDRIAALCREEQVDGIITSFSDLLLECMVKIADKAGLPCYLKPEQLPWYRDKSACRLLLEKTGTSFYRDIKKISVDFLREKTETELAATVGELTYPLICKPLDKYGSRGIFIIHNPKEIRQKALQTAEYTSCEEILIEEYNDGYEFNMMTWVTGQKVQVISIADREKNRNGRGDAASQHPKCISLLSASPGGRGGTWHSAGIYPSYWSEGWCIIHAVFLETGKRYPGM